MPRFQVNSGPVAITGGATKTVVDLAIPAGCAPSVEKWWVGSDATSAGTATSALRAQIGLFSAAVTTHTAYTPDPWLFDANGLGANTTAGIATTVEGAGTATRIEEIPLGLTQSLITYWEPVARLIPQSSFWRIRIIAPANIGTTNVYAGVLFNE